MFWPAEAFKNSSIEIETDSRSNRGMKKHPRYHTTRFQSRVTFKHAQSCQIFTAKSDFLDEGRGVGRNRPGCVISRAGSVFSVTRVSHARHFSSVFLSKSKVWPCAPWTLSASRFRCLSDQGARRTAMDAGVSGGLSRILGDAHVRVSRPCVIVPLRPFIRTRGALEISHPEAVRQKEKREHKIFSRKFVHMK